jgi:hypothetical protein
MKVHEKNPMKRDSELVEWIQIVMPGLVPCSTEDVDGRVKPGHDAYEVDSP